MKKYQVVIISAVAAVGLSACGDGRYTTGENIGLVGGTVAGGIIGNQFGGTAATVGGAVVGGLVGREVGSRVDNND